MRLSTPRSATGSVRFATAVSQHGDAARAAEDLVAALDPDAALFVVFVTPPFDVETLGIQLGRHWGDRVIGCTSTRFFGHPGAEQARVMAVALSGDLTARTVPILPLDQMAAALQAAEPALTQAKAAARRAEDEAGHTFALVLVDGLSLQEEHLVSALTIGLGGIPLIGGSASDHLRFEQTLVLAGGRFVDNAATCTFITTPAPFSIFRLQHYEPRDDVLVITSATPEKRLVHEINGMPAAWAYAEAIGVSPQELTSDMISAHPLVLRAGSASWVRAVAQVYPDATLRFFAAIDTGAVLRLAEPVDPLTVLREGFRTVREKVGDLAGVLAFDCVLRHAEFQRSGVEDQVAQELQRHGVTGFSTYGEQYDDMHVNQTLVGVAFGRGATEPDAPRGGSA